MKFKDFFIIIKDSAANLIKNPLIIIPSFLLIIYFNYFYLIADYFKDYLTTNIRTAIWLVFSILILAAVAAIFSNSTLLIAQRSKSFFRENIRFFIPSFLVFAVYYALLAIDNYVSTYLTQIIGIHYGLPLNQALAIFISIQLIFLLGVFIFLIYAPALIIIKEYSFWKSIKNSISIARKTYPYLLLLGILYFIISSFIELLNKKTSFNYSLIFEIINVCILSPLILVILSKMSELKK